MVYVSIPDRVLGFFRLVTGSSEEVATVSIPDRVLGFFRLDGERKSDMANFNRFNP